MAKNLLSDKAVGNAKPKEREYLLADGEGLFLRVRPTGAKDWLVVYSFAGKRRKLGLGSYPTVTLATARTEADKARKSVAQVVDPQLERKQREAAQEAQRQAEASRLTVKALFEQWEKLELLSRKDKGAEARRSFEKDIFPKAGNMVAADVTRPVVAKLLDDVVARGSPIIARNLLGDLRQMFGFGIKRGYVENDPTSHLKRDDFGRKVERERHLSEAEVRELARKMPNAGMGDASVAALWITLATCCRVGEISQARITDVDMDAGEWFIPAGNSKNSKAHTVNLSEFAKAKFRFLIERAQKLESDWVLPARYAEGHVDLKSLTKQVGDRQRGSDSKPMKNRSPQTDSLSLSGGKWTPHDLRRTGATIMGELGVRSDVIEKCLNHVEANRLKRIYQRQELRPEMREAWRLLGDRLELLTCDDADNVIPIRAA